jgi:Domain of unknown function (DUF4157)
MARPIQAPKKTPLAIRNGILRRTCACGTHTVAGADCPVCASHTGIIQRKLAVGRSTDPLEREADRVAEQVMATPSPSLISATPPRIQRHREPASGELTAAPASVDQILAGSGRPLDPPLREEMEHRFQQDFSRVRVHTDASAAQSAHELNAHAYTAGHHVVFGEDRFAPQREAGRRLLAHELTHVVQQSGPASCSSHALIQRQPTANPPPSPTLKSAGVDLNDPVASGTAAIVDTVLARNKKLAPYIGDRLKGGFKIAEKGKFTHDLTDANFDSAFLKAYPQNAGSTVPKSTMGFLDQNNWEIHLRPGAVFGTALHEAVHRLASTAIYTLYLRRANNFSTDLVEVLSEGFTAFFTDCILTEEQMPHFNDAYRSKKDKAVKLIKALDPGGFDLIARLNFKGDGIIQIGEKLQFSQKQFIDARSNAIPEVLKRMAQVL